MRAIEDDRALVEAAQRDPARFADLYEQNFYRVYAYTARRVQDRHDAEDLTAEVFREALAGIGKFEWRGVPFAAWLMEIERNATLLQLVNRLPEAQFRVIHMRFVEQKSIREIAQDMQRSEGAVKQLQLRAIENLRAQMDSAHA